ncbi:hypothetical protein V2J09_004416 [Rumex salicifolius]
MIYRPPLCTSLEFPLQIKTVPLQNKSPIPPLLKALDFIYLKSDIMEMAQSENNTQKRKLMIMEALSQGQNLAKQLKNHLDDPSAPIETREHLVRQIISTYIEAINVANSQPCDQITLPGRLISHSGGDTSETNRRRPSKKRKSLPQWVEKVKVESETEQGTLNDGFNWRKYGQKDIHGAAFPRGYFRCSHLHSQGCIATKQIQKSDEDPTIFHVIYRGHHTCTQSPLTYQDTPPVPHPIKPDPEHVDVVPTITEPATPSPEQPEPVAPQDRFFFRCFSFSTAPFLETAAGELANEWFISEASPGTSGSNILRSSSSGNNIGGCGGVWTSDSEFNDQGTASPMNSPIPDWPGFSLEELGIFDPNFSFDNPEIFP